MKRLFALLCVLLAITGCAAQAETVVASFYPVWVIARNLAEGIDGLEVENLAEPVTGCLHDYTLQSSDMVALSRADLLLINGAGMEPFLPVITAAYPELPIVDGSEGLLLLETDEDGESNPHVWMDPRLAAQMAANLARGMAERFPDRAGQLEANLEAYQARLDQVQTELRESFAGAETQKVIVFHEALPYFAQACGLDVAATVNKEPEEDLPTSQLARLMELIQSGENLPLLLKSTETDRSAQVLVAETGIPVCELDPMTTGPEEPPLDYYETVMRRNLEQMKSMLRRVD